jgi:hypothetical protein
LLKVLYKKPQKEIKIQTKNIPPKQSKKIQALDKLIPIKNFITDIRFLIALTIFVLSIPIYNFFFSLKDEVNIAQNKMEEITKTIKPILIKNLKAKDQDIFAIKSFKNFNLSDEVKKNKPSTNPIEKKEPEDKNEKDQKVSFNQIQGIPVDLIEDEELEDFKILPESVKDIDLDETNYVYIAAIDGDSWITYKADDQQVLTRTIKKDSSITIKGKNIFIYMGNNDVTKMFYNNQLVKRRNDQNVMSYVFPLEEAKNHFRPLFILSDAGSMVFYQKHPDFIEQSTTQTN